mmetsp:Transcript_17898/g.26270  ORF Transcript_17898/g.26270 Transcript_17898/m.26270 type:complete len:230 (-) Transcript_17898:66-755(-)
MPLSKIAINHIKTILTSHGPDKRFPILTKSQILKFLQGTSSSSPENDKPKPEAAVLVPICNIQGQPSIMFTLRSNTLRSHSNEVSFPGGHVDENDETKADTALRETIEEVRGSYDYDNKVDILGETGAVPAKSGTMVTPILAAFTEDFSDMDHFRQVFNNPNQDEVECVFARTLEELNASEGSETLKRLGAKAPVYPGPEGKIWGMTAYILRPVLSQILLPAFSSNERL